MRSNCYTIVSVTLGRHAQSECVYVENCVYKNLNVNGANLTYHMRRKCTGVSECSHIVCKKVV